MRQHTVLVWLVFCLLLLAALPALAGTFQGRVVGVTDGDTIDVLRGKQVVTVRLAGIDTPETGQPYGTRAKQALSELVFGKTVRVEQRDRDRYGRVVGRVDVEGAGNVNAARVEGGHAWVYHKYAEDPTLYRLEEQAQSKERGL